MDSVEFDRLARSLVTQSSRRRVLAGALSAAVGSLVPLASHSSVRADHKHGRGRDKDKDKDKHKGHGNGNGNGNVPPSNPCEGEADGACCAGKHGEHWCQGGSCVAVPSYGTITQCRGACGAGAERLVTVCGATMSCPFCDDPAACRACGRTFCDGIMGPFGIGSYCVRQTNVVCGNGDCPAPAQCCPISAIGCVELCVP